MPDRNTYGPTGIQAYIVGRELLKLGHDVLTLAPTGSRAETELVHVPHEPEAAYNEYKKRLTEHEVILDFTGLKWSYMAKVANRSLRIIGILYPKHEYKTPPPVQFPCFTAYSEAQAQNTSLRMWSPTKVIPFLIERQPEPEDEVSTETIAAEGTDATTTEAQSTALVNPDVITREPEPKPKPEPPRLMFLGRMTHPKGVHEALEVGIRSHLGIDLVGEDIYVPDQSYITTLIQRADGLVVRHMGRLTEEMKLEYLNKCRAVIAPNLTAESAWSYLPIIEALSCGKPVVATRIPPIAEIIKDGVNGFIVDALEDMAEKVKDVDSISPDECKRSAEPYYADVGIKVYDDLIKQVVEAEW